MHVCGCKKLQTNIRGEYNSFKQSYSTKYFIEQLVQALIFKYTECALKLSVFSKHT